MLCWSGLILWWAWMRWREIWITSHTTLSNRKSFSSSQWWVSKRAENSILTLALSALRTWTPGLDLTRRPATARWPPRSQCSAAIPFTMSASWTGRTTAVLSADMNRPQERSRAATIAKQSKTSGCVLSAGISVASEWSGLTHLSSSTLDISRSTMRQASMSTHWTSRPKTHGIFQGKTMWQESFKIRSIQS